MKTWEVIYTYGGDYNNQIIQRDIEAVDAREAKRVAEHGLRHLGLQASRWYWASTAELKGAVPTGDQ